MRNKDVFPSDKRKGFRFPILHVDFNKMKSHPNERPHLPLR